MLLRIVLGALLASLVAAVAVRARALSRSGSVAAFVLGTTAVAAGWSWGALLVVFFAVTSALSAHGSARKALLVRATTAKGGARDASQVFANGAVFAAGAVAWAATGSTLWLAAGSGAIAAAAADSWATELGVLHGGEPRSIVSGRKLPRGLSGGVTPAGSLGGAAGAAVIGATMLIIGWPLFVALTAAFAGVVGMITDSLLGATLQSRRMCPACATETERAVHDCGTATTPHSGQPWMDNDAVNALATLAGATTAAVTVGALL